ncbi:MAG: nucleotidyl transferase AbiEii/AbiGii toxin family protein [Candidatus Paceibacterota bacterium]|jgi:predicted nucleotidyltransferase component of viral defense system
MHEETLAKSTKVLLDKLSKVSWLSDFYLAGGTGLALQIGHRISVDLDFFTEKEFNEIDLISKLSSIGDLEVIQRSSQSITGTLDEVKFSFLGYKYPILNSCMEHNGVRIASIEDIACMKLDALSSRGTKRDFIDLYFIAKKIPMTSILELFEQKYATVKYNMMHIKKSMVYFDDTKDDPTPNMIIPVEWEDIKKFFAEQVVNL